MSAASQKSSGRSSTGLAGPVSRAVEIIRTGGCPVKGTRLLCVECGNVPAMRRAGR